MSNYSFFIKNVPVGLSANTTRVAEYLARFKDKQGDILAVKKQQI